MEGGVADSPLLTLVAFDSFLVARDSEIDSEVSKMSRGPWVCLT